MRKIISLSTATKKRTKENAAHCGFYFLLTVNALIGIVSTGLPALAKLTFAIPGNVFRCAACQQESRKGERKAQLRQASIFTHPFQSPRCCEWQSGSIAPDGRLSVVLPGAATTRPRLTLTATD